MSIRRSIEQHPAVAPDEVDDIIEVAARLQDQRGVTKPSVSPDEIRAVAAELDIDPSLVDEAIRVYRSERSAAVEQRSSSRRRLLLGAAVAGTMVVAALATCGAIGASGAARLDAASVKVQRSTTALEAVLERQASLLPQLTGLAGGDPAALSAAAQAAASAADMDARLQASRRLGEAMASQIAALPNSDDPSQAQLRLNLQHEISGSVNRITVEQRRYDDARDDWEREASTRAGRLALALGMAEPIER
jgi:LemA protein